MKIDAAMPACGLFKIQVIPTISYENKGIKYNKRPLLSARRLYKTLKRAQPHSPSAGNR